MNYNLKKMQRFFANLNGLLFVVLLAIVGVLNSPIDIRAETSANVYLMEINGTINPATDDFLKSSLAKAKEQQAKLLIIKLNTPGGLLTSMQTMVGSLLESPIPTVVYVSPSGGGATSAGVFITMAANFAVMAPGTTIGAAHPVTGGGQDVEGDMREKIENFTVSHIKAIAEQRGRNVEWAEKAVRESVSITDREAVSLKVVDFIATDIEDLLSKLEGRKLTIESEEVVLEGLKSMKLNTIEMTFKQKVINILSDPNIAILLGLAAMVGLGIEMYNPGLVLPGIVGAICLVLSLTAAQVLPINYGGVLLLLLSAVFFIVELFIPTFGVWGIAGIICLVLGSIYVIDSDLVWSVDGFTVDSLMVGSIAFVCGSILLIVSLLVIKDRSSKVVTGAEGLVGKKGKVRGGFSSNSTEGKVNVNGEIWNAKIENDNLSKLTVNQGIVVTGIENGMTLLIRPE
jgi:membrane-bound serine protease (ClpP class)